MSPYKIDLAVSLNYFLYSTVRLVATNSDGSTSVGTGFFYDASEINSPHEVLLVTNNHVIENAVHVRMQVHLASKEDRNNREFCVDGQQWLDVHNPARYWVSHPDSSIDLCAATLNSILAEAPPIPDLFFNKFSSGYVPKNQEDSRYYAMMQIAMIGYPNGLWDEANNMPILRRGTTASHPAIDFEGREEVVVDIACFPGSSGSPILFYDLQYFASAVRFLGVLYAGPQISVEGDVVLRTIPTHTGPTAHVNTMMHLGYAIKAAKVQELAEHIASIARGV